MTKQEIIKEMAKLTNPADLKAIQIYSFERYKTLTRANADLIGWHPGQRVQLKPEHRNRKPWDAKGTVKKVNSVKLIVKFDDFPAEWTVPKTILQEVE